MKCRSLIIMLLLAFGATAPAQDAKTAFETAVNTYQAGKYGEAHDQFTRLNQQFGPHPAYAFNAGNAAYSAGRLPEAVIRYQEALELDPNFRAARQNLALVQAEAQAMPGSLEKGMVLPRVPLNLLVTVATILLWLGLICAALVFAKLLRKRPGVSGAAAIAVLAILGALGLGLLSAEKWRQHVHQQIGVVVKFAVAYGDISEVGPRIAELKPGTSVLVKSQRGNHVYALMPNGQQGWLPLESVQLVQRREFMVATK